PVASKTPWLKNRTFSRHPKCIAKKATCLHPQSFANTIGSLYQKQPPTAASTGGSRENAPRKRALTSRRDREGSVKPASFAWKHAYVLPPGSMTCPSPRSSVLFDAEALRHVFLAAPCPAPWLSNRR